MTEGEDDDDEDGEKAEVTGEVLEEGDDVLVLLMDRSTGSVWVWNCSDESRSSGGSAFTLLSRSGTVSISG